MTCTIQLTQQETDFVNSYSNIHDIPLQELFKQALFEKIEDEYDILSYEQAKQEFEKNPVTYTHEEFWSGILD